jgi:protein-S-isoprenylcysteine O-methyltransferase Ste14
MLRTRVPPPVYALLAGIAMWLLDRHWPIVQLWDPPRVQIGCLLVIAGIAIDAWAIAAFFRFRTTIDPMHPERATQLITTGLYRFTRNPMYLGLLLVLTGWACLLGSAGPLLVLPLFVWIISALQIVPEEAAMAERFGAAYASYAQRVPRWIGLRNSA